jgi:hypothetical protein
VRKRSLLESCLGAGKLGPSNGHLLAVAEGIARAKRARDSNALYGRE